MSLAVISNQLPVISNQLPIIIGLNVGFLLVLIITLLVLIHLRLVKTSRILDKKIEENLHSASLRVVGENEVAEVAEIKDKEKEYLEKEKIRREEKSKIGIIRE